MKTQIEKLNDSFSHPMPATNEQATTGTKQPGWIVCSATPAVARVGEQPRRAENEEDADPPRDGERVLAAVGRENDAHQVEEQGDGPVGWMLQVADVWPGARSAGSIQAQGPRLD